MSRILVIGYGACAVYHALNGLHLTPLVFCALVILYGRTMPRVVAA